MLTLEQDRKIWNMVINHFSKKFPLMTWEDIMSHTKAEKMMLRLGISEEHIVEAFRGN